MSEVIADNEYFIPIIPTKTRRFGIMILQALPGFALMLSVIGTNPATVGAVLLNAFCLISGLVVTGLSIFSYIRPNRIKSPEPDMIAVLTGLLLITQGTQLFDALKDFQRAHLYFIAAALFIFIGVMFPGSKIKKGFLISDERVKYSSSPFRKSIVFPIKSLKDISLSGSTIVFSYSTGEIKKVILQGVENSKELLDSLKSRLLLKG